ncbi:MarR family winged helix-turn-helix transcriptional regulator [Apibacter adventoris]|uniref:HTH marR-type domain-containing protein n=1 Tax=Apibacter adventoris TaxID=1679466 RepID=A0A2S8A827_9FLAO|nr:MarR family transcriptional regulator [Apibacter adventoris]PQL90727.1 hypothetical protein C4S77_09725 [Apibacter adventoris]
MIKSDRESSISYQISYTENLLRNVLNARLNEFNVDITPEQFLILDLLIEENKEISMQWISKKIHRDNSSITRSIDCLEKKNYVSRINALKDRRKKIIIITEKGKEIYIEAKKVAKQHIEITTTRLTNHQIEELLKSLKIIQQNLIIYKNEDKITQTKSI